MSRMSHIFNNPRYTMWCPLLDLDRSNVGQQHAFFSSRQQDLKNCTCAMHNRLHNNDVMIQHYTSFPLRKDIQKENCKHTKNLITQKSMYIHRWVHE